MGRRRSVRLRDGVETGEGEGLDGVIWDVESLEALLGVFRSLLRGFWDILNDY